MEEMTYKQIILSRYCGQFLQATEQTATIRKSSQEIMMDLRPMVDLSINEISEYMIGMEYQIGFDADTPVWLMCENNEKLIENT